MYVLIAALYSFDRAEYNPDILQQFNDLPFYLLKVSAPFNPTSRFSQVDLSFNKFDLNKYIRFDTLFDFSPLLLSTPNVRPQSLVKSIDVMIKQLQKSHRCPWSSDFLKEDDVMLELCKTVLLPLFDEVALEPRYKRKCKLPGAKAQDIGLGTVDTWHGMPDTRIGCCCIVSTSESLHSETEDNFDSESLNEPPVPAGQDPSSAIEQESSLVLPTESPSSAASVEGELSMKPCHTSQFVALSVTSSFTQHNIEPKENSLVPTIMINSNGFKVCLYDCEHDILLISEVKNIAQQGHLSPSGILMLWIVVHHRQFLRRLDSEHLKHSLGYKSTIVDKLKMFSVHEKFLKLKNLYVDWGDIRRDPEGPTYPRTELLPPLKKMKYDSGEQ